MNDQTPSLDWNGKIEPFETVASVAQAKGSAPQDLSNLQVRTPETLLFATLDGLVKSSGVPLRRLLRLVLKELGDNGLDAADAAGRSGQVEAERLGDRQFRIEDQGAGIPGTDEELAALFSIGRDMLSAKFLRRPERGALGNGLRIIVGTIAATSGTIEITTRGRRLLLHPRKAGYTQISETSPVDYLVGTRLVVTFGSDFPADEDALLWANSAVAIAQATGQPCSRPTSPHWIDADNMAQILQTIEPADTTVRQLIERLDGCSGAKAGKIAAPFGKGKLCRDMSEQQAGELVTATQSVTRRVRPDALIRLGPGIFGEEFDGYDCESGSVITGLHAPYADIPFLVEVWASVTDKKGDDADLKVFANRTPVVPDATAERRHDGTIQISGLNTYYPPIDAKQGSCSIVVHLTSPRIPILSTGKRPDFSPFKSQLDKAIRLAFNRSHRNLPDDPADAKPPKQQKPVKPPRPPKPVHVPTTTLGIFIAKEAREHGLSEDDLTVMSVGRDPCRFDNAKAFRDGRWFADLVDKYVPKRLKAHVRGIYYRSVGNLHRPDTGKLLINNKANWGWFKTASLAARWLGLVEFDKIRDGRNDPPEYYLDDGTLITPTGTPYITVDAEDIGATVIGLDRLLPRLSITGGQSIRQPYQLVFYGEKSSIGDELRDLAKEVHASLILCTGDASTTYIAELMARAAHDGRPLVVLYAADFDPGGYTMPPTVARKLQALVLMKYPYLKVQLHRVALTIDQVLHPTGTLDEAEPLPSTILSDGNTRSKPWKAKWGREQTEIDALMALYPGRLEAIFREAIRPFFDPSLQRRIDEAKQLPDATLDWVKALPEYQSAVTTITDLHGPASDAVDALNEGMEHAIKGLRVRVRDAADAPKVPELDIHPEITAIAPEPLFTTDDTFVVATLKMRQEKEWSVTPKVKSTRSRRRKIAR